jgi:hypothetical protein
VPGIIEARALRFRNTGLGDGTNNLKFTSIFYGILISCGKEICVLKVNIFF